VDTDVLSYLLNRHTLALTYEELLVGPTPFISFMTVAEMYRGAFKRNWGPRRIGELATHLRQFVVVPYNVQICVSYARACAEREKGGNPIDTADALIAASAVWLGIPLVTNNKLHFQGIEGLTVISAA